MKRLNLFMAFALISAISCSELMAQRAPSLGDAASFAVLGSATVTNTGPTVVTGNLGVSPGTAVTGFPPGKITNGMVYSGAPSGAGAAQVSAKAAYADLESQTSPKVTDLTGKILGETTGAIKLTPGIYKFSSSAQLNATLTLDDGGDPNAVFIFQIGSTLTTASYSNVVMSGGGKGANVYWQIGSSATIGTYTSFTGNILALASITMTTGAKTTGRLFALNAAVTMDTNEAFAVAPQVADKDGDGVPDSQDDYPNDPTRAYNNYSSAVGGSTYAFEDKWPVMGDYDLNDLVITTRYNAVTNAQNIVVEVKGEFTLAAGGGANANGFGVEFPISRSLITNMKGATLETNQTKAVVILFTDMHTELSAWNTIPGAPSSPTKNYSISFDVVNGPALKDFGTDYNNFIFNYEGSSRREVHAVGKAPTALADLTVLGTLDDGSNVSLSKYYVTKTGMPFCINMPASTFRYPAEYTDISKAYLHFKEWAESGGKSFVDWYSNENSGYRDIAFIYK